MKNTTNNKLLTPLRTSCLWGTVLLFCALFFTPGKGEAQTFHFPSVTYVDSLALKSIVSTSVPYSFTVKTDEFSNMNGATSGPGYNIKSVIALVAMKVDVRSLNVSQYQKFAYLITYRTIGRTHPTATPAGPSAPDTLSISYNRDSLALNNDYTFKVAGNFSELEIIIDNVIEVTTNSTGGLTYTPLSTSSSSLIPDFITVRGQIQLQKYSTLASMNIANGSVVVTDKVSTEGVVGLNWKNALGHIKPAGYEIEWTYLLPGETNYNFRSNSTRIFTNDTSFNIPVAQKQGKMLWRMRMVRPELTNLLSRTYGDWNYGEAGTAPNSSGGNCIMIASSGNDSVNWDLKMSFVEDGKYKQVVTYYDGLLKQKQVQTRFNAMPSQTIVAQSLLDFEGRPVISSLPIPVHGKTKFQYVPDFMRPADSLHQYSKNMYDALPDTSACPITERVVSALDTGALGNKYYSRQNPDRTGKNAYIPDAEGYPFTRRILAAENPEKVLFEGGAGAPLQLGSNKQTAYLYGVPLQAEINRYFGQDIGVYNHYRKRVTTDGHSQDGFSITDKEGKPVITGLIGSPDTGRHALSIRNAPVSADFKTNLLPLPNKRMGSKWMQSGSYFVELQANFNFSYGIKYKPFRPCNNDSNGLIPILHYEYEILDACGNIRANDTGSLGEIGFTKDTLINYSKAKDSFLQKGNHVWNKKSYIKIEEVTASVDAYLESSETCLLTLDDYVKREFINTTFPCLPNKNSCESLRLAMIKELYPGAKYGQYVYEDDTNKAFIPGAPNPNSIFTYYPNTSSYRYQSFCLGNGEMPITHKGITYANLKSVPPHILIEVFNDDIGDYLLPLHPDYCKLMLCPLTNTDYCSKLGSMKKAGQALDENLYTLDQIVNNDPLSNLPPPPATVQSLIDSFSGPRLAVNMRGESIDTLAFRKTICGSEIDIVEGTCNLLNAHKGPDAIQGYSAAMQDAYYQNLVATYAASREERIGEYMRTMTADCGPCAEDRMENYSDREDLTPLSDSALFVGGFDSVRTNLGLNSTPSGSSFFNPTTGTNDSVRTLTNADNSIYCTAQVSSIIASLENCPMSAFTLGRLRDTLTARFCTPNRGKLAQLTYDSLTSILQYLQITPSDLCNAGLVNLWKTGNRSGAQVQLGLLQYGPDYYQNMEDFFKRSGQDIMSFIASGDTSKIVQLRPCNTFPFELALAQRLGYTQPPNCNSTTSITLEKTNITSIDTLAFNAVKLTFKSNSDSIGYYLYPSQRTETNALNTAFGATAISNTTDYELKPVFNLYGFDQVSSSYANRNTLLFGFKGTRNGTDQDFRYFLSAFNYNADYLAMEPDAPQYLNGVGCSELLPMVTQTLNEANKVNMRVGHPFFETFFENVTNFDNRIHFSFESYETAIRSCGLTDSLLLPKQMAQFEVQFPAIYNTRAYLDSVRQRDSVTLTLVNAYELGGTKHLFLDVDPNGTRNAKEAHQILINALSGFSSSVRNTPALGRDTIAQLLSSGLSPVDVSGLMNAFPGLDVTSTSVTLEYYIPGVGVTPMPGSELITLTLPGTILSNYDYNHLTDSIYKYVIDAAPITVVFSHSEPAVSNQYADVQMAEWRSYVHALDADNHNAVVKGSKSDALQISGGGIFDAASYVNARYPQYRNDLYIGQVSPAGDSNFSYVEQLLYGLQQSNINSTTPGGLLSATPSGSPIIGVGGMGNPIVESRSYVCSDTTVFWINHFDAARKMLNIFVKLPAYLPHPRNQYQLTDVAKGFEKDSVTHLMLTFALPQGSTADEIVCPAFCNRNMGTDYVIPTAFLSSYSPHSAYAAVPELSCEQAKIQSLYPRARANYKLYRDLMRDSLVGLFQQDIIDNLVEYLDASGKDIKHGLTLYYYDVAGNLIKTVSPEGVHTTSVAGSDNDTINARRVRNDLNGVVVPLHGKETKYYYNAQNKVIRTSSPDAGTAQTYYDLMGRVTFSQDADQANSGKGVYFIYDRLSRVVESGVVPAVFSDWSQDISTTLGEPRATALMQQYRREVSVTLYDTASYNNVTGTFTSVPLQDNLKNRVACTKYFEIVEPHPYVNALTDTAYDHALHYSYDLSGNVKTLIHDFRSLFRPELRLKRVDYEYDLYSGKVLMVAYNRGGADGFYQKYKYDADNRIIEASSSAEGIVWDRDAEYEYYEHGPLARTSLGNQRVQGVDYAYTINGWLKAINGAQNGAEFDMGKDGENNGVTPRDVASQRIDYFNRDYRAIGPDSLFLEHLPQASKDLFNGNIGGMAVALAPFNNLYKSYRYDPLQRIETSRNGEYSYTQQQTALPAVAPIDDWATNYQYDKDGNLQQLNRQGGTVPAGQQGPGSSAIAQTLMDDLTYRYTAGTNKLRNLQEQATTADYRIDIQKSGPGYSINQELYTYDAAGRLTMDKISGLNTIGWNHWSKVKKIEKQLALNQNSTLSFTYDAVGNRLSKEEAVEPVKDSMVKRRTVYVRDAAGNVLAVYENVRRYKTTYSGSGPIFLPEAEPYPGPIGTSYPYPFPTSVTGGVPTTRYPVGWRWAVASGMLKAYGQNPNNDLAMMAMGLPTLQEYSSQPDLLNELIEGFSSPQVVAFAKSMPLVTNYALGGTAPDEGEGGEPPVGGSVPPAKLRHYLEPVLAGGGAMGTFQGALLSALKGGDEDLYNQTVYAIPASAEDKAGFPSTDGGRLLEALNGMEIEQRLHLTNGLAQALGGAHQEALLLVRPVVMSAYSTANTYSEFVLGVPNADGVVSELRADAATYVAHRFMRVGEGVLERDSVALPFSNNGVLATALTTSTEGDEPPSPEALSAVLNGYLPQLQNAAASAGKTDELNAALLVVNLETDQPELTAHLDPWYQKVQVLKEDKTSLAEHHLYGSSRLGIQRYITGQKAYDPVTPTVGSGSGAAQPLVQKRAWYSMWGNDLFAPITATGTAASDPLSTDNMGTTGIGIQPHILGNRHYELTNHLGNVMATILDRSTPRLVNSSANNKDSLVGYSADISSAQDYYPFGMLMPGRYISDNSPQCITTQQTTLVPKTVRVYIDLTPAPHLPFPGGPIIATPYPWGPIKDLPIEASFRQQQARFNHYLPAEEHPGGFAARALPGGGGYELDLSDEPSGLSLYLPFGIDTGGSQVLGFGVGMLPAGVRLEARVRHYGADTSSEEYTEPVRWRNVRAGEQVELRFGLPSGSAGKLVAELRFSAEGGAGKFGVGRRVEIRDPWIEKTEWSTESRLVTLCDEKDKYRYGFNGQEKVNEIAGTGNHLAFEARGYDSRLGRFWSIDPLAKSFPSESNYTFSGNSPSVLVDKEGKKKTTYINIFNEKTGGTTQIKLVVPGLKSYPTTDFYSGITTHNWFDTKQVITININNRGGRTISASDIELDGFRTNTFLKDESRALSKTGELDERVKDDRRFGGWIGTSKFGGGVDNEFEPKAGDGSRYVDMGSIFGAFAGSGFVSSKGLAAIQAGFLEESKKGTPFPLNIFENIGLIGGNNKSTGDTVQCDVSGGCGQLHTGGQVGVEPAEGKEISDYPESPAK